MSGLAEGRIYPMTMCHERDESKGTGVVVLGVGYYFGGC